MTTTTRITLTAVFCCAFAGCNPAAEPPRTRGYSVVVMQPLSKLGKPQRAPVEFPHGIHTDALLVEGCEACHGFDRAKRLIPGLAGDAADMDAYMSFFHNQCTGCHLKRAGGKTGPVTCGECHVERPGAVVSARSPMKFDYSLHQRHVLAEGGECSGCHHVYDEEQKNLVYQKGAEDACGACHGESDAEGQTSLRTAAHVDCVSCHLRRQGRDAGHGPSLCAGCHAAPAQNEIAKIDNPPPPDRGQPASMWIAAEAATTRAVLFDHRLHQAQTDSCSACHHQSIGKCDQCHTLATRPEGGGIPLEQAYHMPNSAWSCVGCHKESAGQGQCAGCHRTSAGVPGQAACEVCHWGPLPEEPENTVITFPKVALEGLPAAGPDFPEDVEIGVLAEKYQPSQFPHKKIVAALDQGVQASRLARRFHQKTRTLCAGCHHHSPPSERPPACRSCHSTAADPQKDLPDLTAAYHRQCIGCHQAIGHEAQGCTDCHQEVSR